MVPGRRKILGKEAQKGKERKGKKEVISVGTSLLKL